MRIKKGFTLAEILIVLMVIGVIATMTIPGLMKGVQEAQMKTGYKKAYNTLVNLGAMASVAGELPARANTSTLKDFYIMLARNLSVKGFISSYGPDTGSANSLKNITLGGKFTSSDGTSVQVGATSVTGSLDPASGTTALSSAPGSGNTTTWI